MSEQPKSEFLPDGRRRPSKPPRNGPMTPEDLIPYGINRPMKRIGVSTRFFTQDIRLLGEMSRQTKIPQIIMLHIMIMDMLKKINSLHREAGATEDKIKLEDFQKDTDYFPFKGVYKNWEANHAAAVAKPGSRPAGA